MWPGASPTLFSWLFLLFLSVPHCDLAFDPGHFLSFLLLQLEGRCGAWARVVSGKCPVHLRTFLSKHIFSSAVEIPFPTDSVGTPGACHVKGRLDGV